MGDQINLTWGFWPGIVIGTFCGLFVFGLAWHGQNQWDQAVSVGRLLCEIDFSRAGLYMNGAADE